ncbi:hypothetical protein QBC39DRAFT_67080 [Podospora conica]|nr:hypothetical protein QBC39DRAFT_67080 [Schizothecium conicum]
MAWGAEVRCPDSDSKDKSDGRIGDRLLVWPPARARGGLETAKANKKDGLARQPTRCGCGSFPREDQDPSRNRVLGCRASGESLESRHPRGGIQVVGSCRPLAMVLREGADRGRILAPHMYGVRRLDMRGGPRLQEYVANTYDSDAGWDVMTLVLGCWSGQVPLLDWPRHPAMAWRAWFSVLPASSIRGIDNCCHWVSMASQEVECRRSMSVADRLTVSRLFLGCVGGPMTEATREKKRKRLEKRPGSRLTTRRNRHCVPASSRRERQIK